MAGVMRQPVIYEMAAQFNWLAVPDEAILQLFEERRSQSGLLLSAGRV
jgi:hypothetical protein